MNTENLDTSALHWTLDHILTWSGKWHIIDPEYRDEYSDVRPRALCGAFGYVLDSVPKHHRKLLDIAHGRKMAPLCQRCEKAAARQ